MLTENQYSEMNCSETANAVFYDISYSEGLFGNKFSDNPFLIPSKIR